MLSTGDYVLATKWSDGDPKDPWHVGFYAGELLKGRHFVMDSEGNRFNTAHRRVEKISQERGEFIIKHRNTIAWAVRSLWWWKRCSIEKVEKELREMGETAVLPHPSA